MKDIPAGKEFRNPLVRATEVRGTFETGDHRAAKDGAFEAAVKATNAYAAICEAGRDHELRAEALAAWADGAAEERRRLQAQGAGRGR